MPSEHAGNLVGPGLPPFLTLIPVYPCTHSVCMLLLRSMLKRTNLMLKANDLAVAKRILKEQGTTLSAWVSEQIRKLIARHRNTED